MSNRNTNARFDLAPQVEIPRSTFDRSSNVKTSFNVGDLVPFYVDEVLPGDTFQIDTSKVCRLQTLIAPVMDNLFLDTYYFFVPNRLVWDHWQEFCGENTQSAWTQTVEYSVPQITAPSGGWSIGTIADYFGIPTGVSNLSVNALPFRAYSLICNDWFRDENLSQPLLIPTDDTTVSGVNTGVTVTDVCKGGKPFKAAKYHDYFTSCLPSPQKGPSVSLPLGESAPVFTGPANMIRPIDVINRVGQINPVSLGYWTNQHPEYWNATNLRFLASAPGANDPAGHEASYLRSALGDPPGSTATSNIVPTNLYADLGVATAASINELRQAFQVQRLFERDARGGTRYIEILQSHFGVTSPDARLQRPEYLGGNRVPLNIQQVTQTSSTNQTSPLASLAAYSQTGDVSNDVSKSFVEHGYIIGVCCARYDHSYQQGLERMWSRRTRFNFYWPALANLGEQAVLNKEIYAQGNEEDDKVFGYQEAWAEYRYKPNHICGEMRSSFAQSLDVWHFADNYESLPHLSSDWINEDASNIDRTLAVQSSLSNQVFADILVNCKVTRPMPLYSIPGLIDHF